MIAAENKVKTGGKNHMRNVAFFAPPILVR
jgi:hypothetical protein